jgi:hypothetical protein
MESFNCNNRFVLFAVVRETNHGEATFRHWKYNKMVEEYLFRDKQSYMKQIGLAKKIF